MCGILGIFDFHMGKKNVLKKRPFYLDTRIIS